ncbi:MAG: Trm112 family protein [Bryobacterales bacterium]|nr:Trm112 family protein [Bryobacterales bacterium]
MSPEILEILVCPLCKARLELAASSSDLECLSCHRIYPVFDGVPVMYMAESRIENPFSHDLPRAGWKRTPLPAQGD